MGRSVLRPYKPIRLAAVYGSEEPPLLRGLKTRHYKGLAGDRGRFGLGGAGFVNNGSAD
jgi:hypothetical protein